MKLLFKKPWFIGSLMIGLMVIIFFINLWIMSLDLKAPYDEDSILSLASNLSIGANVNIYSFVLMIVFYVSILPILLSGLSLLKKNHWGFLSSIIYLLAFDSALIIFQSLYQYMTIFSIILVIINIIFTIGIFVLMIVRLKVLSLEKDIIPTEKEIELNATKIPLMVLIINILSIVVFLTTFFIPLYTLEAGDMYYAIIINVLLQGDTNIQLIIYFLINFLLFLSLFMYFANGLSNYFFDKERFINQSHAFIIFAFISTIIFFLTGLTMDMYYTLQGQVAQTYAFIPMFLMCAVIFIYSIFKGKFNAFNHVKYKDSTIRFAKIEPLLYVFLMTAVTVLMLLLPIVQINITYSAFTYSVDLTGFNILNDYANLDPGYRIVAYLLVVALISSGLALVITISSYLSKHKQFSATVKFAAMINLFFVFIVAISGYYFQIAQQINQAVLLDLFEYYGVSLPNMSEYTYDIGTQGIYALIASVAVLIIMFFRKAFDRDDMQAIEGNLLTADQPSENSSTSPTIGEESYLESDPCPAFTDLDLRVDEFKQDLEKRKLSKVGQSSLNDLVNFIVEYARNSRLHLSYTPEDIATFISGLGATKLSILQGMSGTGKTSLPKIFSEAILGNCDIIEVESSWKDKNELLGYYNEFSMKYTPKKFTLALYKAALNPEILTFILLDEMNLSRIEYYFSDFLSLMENEEHQREIKLINIKLARKEEDQDIEYHALSQGHTVKVPPNIWFIGTANRDESTFVISDKVYDRAHTMNFTKRAPKVRNYANPIPQQYYDYQTVNQLFLHAKKSGNFDAENSELIKHVEALLAPYNISFGNRILKQIEDFVNIYQACFPKEDVESEAIEKILLSKVVAKLEVKTIDDKEKLEMEFEKLNLHECATFIKRLDNE